MSFFGPIPDHARRHISRTALLHAPGITLSALKHPTKRAAATHCQSKSVAGPLTVFSAFRCRHAAIATAAAAALHSSERALMRSGSNMRYDAEFAVSRKPDQPLSDDGDVELTPPARWSSDKGGAHVCGVI